MEASTTRNPSTLPTQSSYVVAVWEGRAKYLHLLKKVITTVDNSVEQNESCVVLTALESFTFGV